MIKKPFVRYNLGESEEINIKVRLNDEEFKILSEFKELTQIEANATAIKQMMRIGYHVFKLFFDNSAGRYLFKNKRSRLSELYGKK